MSTVTHILWRAAGKPPGDGDAVGTCRVCGQEGVGLPFDDWVRPTFTDWDKLVPGDILCQPCQFAFAERSELLTARVGKEKLQRMRNYSHFVVGGKWIPLSKGDKARMRDILLNESPDVAVVAESGQKHLVFRAVPGVIQFEEQQIPDWRGLAGLLDIVEMLYNGGFSKSEIETGDYAQHRILRFGLSEWWKLEESLRQHRGALLFNLALFLAQKSEKGEQDGRNGRAESDAPAGSGPTGGGVARDTTCVQKPLSEEHLAAVRGQREERGVYQQPGQVHQLAMPEFGR